jgi:hypothetical protein
MRFGGTRAVIGAALGLVVGVVVGQRTGDLGSMVLLGLIGLVVGGVLAPVLGQLARVLRTIGGLVVFAFVLVIILIAITWFARNFLNLDVHL